MQHNLLYITFICLHSLNYRRGVIQPLSRYTASSSGWISWSLDTLVRRPVQWGYQAFVRQPLSWAYSKLTSGSHGTDLNQPRSSGQLATELPDEHYVILDLVKVHSMYSHAVDYSMSFPHHFGCFWQLLYSCHLVFINLLQIWIRIVRVI